MTNTMGTGKAGALCYGAFERGNGTYWEVRRVGAPCGTGPAERVWLVYRTSVAVTLMGTYNTPREAYEEIWKHVPRESNNIEANLSR